MIDAHGGTVTVGGAELPVTSLTATMDESWAPFVQVTECTVALTDPGILDVLDPRSLARARMTLRRDFAAAFPNHDITDAVEGTAPGAELRRNVVRNPRMVNNAARWSVGQGSNPGTLTPVDGGFDFDLPASSSGKGYFGNNSDALPVAPSTQYTASYLVTSPQGGVARLGVAWLTASRAAIAEPTVYRTFSGGAPYRAEYVLTSPANAAYARLTILTYNSSSRITGTVREIALVPGAGAGDYFDGSTAPDDLHLYSWLGAAHESVSIESARFASNADLSAAWAGLSGAQITDRFTVGFNASGIRDSVVRDFDLAVQEITVDHRAGTVQVRLASDEVLLMTHKLVQAGPYTNAGVSLRGLVEAVLARIGAVLGPGAWDAPLVAGSSEWLPGRAAWDYLAPLIEKAGGRLYCDERRVWRLEDREPLASGQLTLSTGANGQLTEARDTISRLDDDGWADAVVVIYRWLDGEGKQQTGYDIAGDPLGQKVITVEREARNPGSGAAAALLKRAQGRGRTLDLSAVSDYGAQPGQATRVELPATPTQTGLVSAVSWRLPAAVMTVRTRGLIDTPPTAWAFTPGGRRWTDVPAGTDWTEYTSG